MSTAERGLRICVFGASGGIGSALCSRLAQDERVARIYAGSRRPIAPESDKTSPFSFDLHDEDTIAAAAREIFREGPLDIVIVATGILQTEDIRPERTWRALEAADMAHMFAVNTIGPALIAKHTLPLLRREGRAVFAALSAKVGSIEDNRIGGWHSYRASKAALNQLIRNFAIELQRSNRDAIAVALHPGTVDTALSKPFQRGLPAGQLTTPQACADNLLQVLGGLGPEDSGQLFGWDGQRIPF